MKELTRMTKTSLKDDCFRTFSSSYLRFSLSLSVSLFVSQMIRSLGRYAKHHLLDLNTPITSNLLQQFGNLRVLQNERCGVIDF